MLRQDERRANEVQNTPRAARTATPDPGPPAGAAAHGGGVVRSQPLALDAVLARAVIQRKLILNDTQRDAAEDVRPDLGTDFDAMRDTVEDLISLPGPPVKISTAALRMVHAYQTAGTRPTSESVGATLQLISHGAWPANARPRAAWDAFNDARVLDNLRELGDWLRANPNVVANLRAAGVGWELMSNHQQINNFGGGAVIEDRIHIADWIVAHRRFGLMVVHESGHATFQRLLLTGEKWTDAANRGEAPPHAEALTAVGRTFYQAWKVLRERPEFFFIVDMPGTEAAATGDGRRAYLASQFTEFCADSFMHFSLMEDELRDHVASLPDTEGAVRKAWERALSVLHLCEPHIRGDETGGWAVATLASHRFRAALEELTTALQGPGLEVADMQNVGRRLERLQRAWQGLGPAGRELHRSAALTALDMYVMKVQRRRPAQMHLGSELGFAGL